MKSAQWQHLSMHFVTPSPFSHPSRQHGLLVHTGQLNRPPHRKMEADLCTLLRHWHIFFLSTIPVGPGLSSIKVPAHFVVKHHFSHNGSHTHVLDIFRFLPPSRRLLVSFRPSVATLLLYGFYSTLTLGHYGCKDYIRVNTLQISYLITECIFYAWPWE